MAVTAGPGGGWAAAGAPGQLPPGLVEVVLVEVRVAEGVDEVADREIAHLGDQVGQQRVARRC